MRRWLLAFLLVVLPLQLSWAAVGSYCKHEQGAAADHFGHHQHMHDASKSLSGDDADDGSLAPKHADCGYCQLSASKACLPSTAVIDPADMLAPTFALAAVFRSHVPAGLERPDRSAAS